MATLFEIRCAHPDASYARQAAQAAFELVDRLEQGMSRFIANSDVARINALAAGQSTRVSPATFECLEIARRMYDVTGGAFDIASRLRARGLEIVPGRVHGVARTPPVCGSTSAASARVTRSTGRRTSSRKWGIPARAGARGLQLRPGPRAASGRRRMVPDPERAGPESSRCSPGCRLARRLERLGDAQEGHIVDPRLGHRPVDSGRFGWR
jgi:hypothetical protein